MGGRAQEQPRRVLLPLVLAGALAALAVPPTGADPGVSGSDEPGWQETHESRGLLTDGWLRAPIVSDAHGTPWGPVPNGFAWTLSERADAVGGIVAELSWPDPTLLAKNLRLVLTLPGSLGDPRHTFVDVRGPSPLRVVIDQAAFQSVAFTHGSDCHPAEARQCTLETHSFAGDGVRGDPDVDAALVVGQEFRVALTVFYRSAPPPGFAHLG